MIVSIIFKFEKFRIYLFYNLEYLSLWLNTKSDVILNTLPKTFQIVR